MDDALFAPVPERQNTSTMAAAALRDAIADGRLAPGERIKESDIARALGISRTPVREAIHTLVAEGLVETEAGRGAVVRTHDANDLDDLFQMRALLEGEAAYRAAARITPAQLDELRASCQRYGAIDSKAELPDLVRENSFFHGLIHEAGGSPRLSAMIRSIADLPLVYRSYIWYSPQQKGRAVEWHALIVASLAAHAGERAENLMKEHHYQARDLLVAYVRNLEAQKASKALPRRSAINFGPTEI